MTDPNAPEPLCDACNDGGNALCDACGGKGTLPNDCPYCVGPDGKRHGGCWECANSKESACDTCDGRGDVLCRECPTCRHCGGLLRDGGHRRCWRIDND